MYHFAPAGFLAFYNRNSQSWHFASVYKKRQFCKKTPQIPTFHLSFFQPAKTFSPDFVCLFFQVPPGLFGTALKISMGAHLCSLWKVYQTLRFSLKLDSSVTG